MRRLFAVFCLSILGGLPLIGCATDNVPAPAPIVKEVRIPTPVPCVGASTPAPPKTPDTPEALQAASPAGQIRLMRAANILLHQWVDEVSPVVEACRK